MTMGTTTMYDLTIAPHPDGGLRLEQSAGSLEEPDIIVLHPLQVRLIAEYAGLLPATPAPCCHAADDDDNEMHHLQVVRDGDGTVHLYQTQLFGMGGSDEHVILHPTQAAWLGARLLACCARPVSEPVGASLESPGGACRVSAPERDSGHPDLFDRGATR